MEKIEYEVRVLEINREEILKKLQELKASFVKSSFQRRNVYDFNPVDPNRWIRLRTDGKTTTLTFKQLESANIDGTKEIEVEVSDFETMDEMLNRLGYFARGKQENYRIQFLLNGVEIDIDTWPRIPEYLEIEGKSEEEVLHTLDLLGIPRERATSLDVSSIYEEVYGIKDSKKDLSFTEGELKPYTRSR
jgi:adenylate cyclase class 2